MSDPSRPLLVLTPHEAETAAAVAERFFPADDAGPGAVEIGVVDYLDGALSGAYADQRDTYRLGLAALDRAARTRWGGRFADGTGGQQDALVADWERGAVEGWAVPAQAPFFELVRGHVQEGLFADPAYGGNRDKAGWRVLGHPGVWLDNTAEENLSPEPVTKGGVIQSMVDVGFALGGRSDAPEVAGYDPQRGGQPPSKVADVVLVGVGGIGGIIAPILCRAGLRVVGLEAGPWWGIDAFRPDELGSAYYCRAEMGQKFRSESPRWRRNAGEPTQELTYSLGRMMNGVGGSVIHYGAWLRRFHPHHLRLRSFALERWGPGAIPEGSTVADWPLTYDELEPYHARVEQIVGIGRDERNPLVPASVPPTLPATRPFRMGELFREATEAMGLHPHPVPVGMTTKPYHDWPEMTYTAWNNGFGSWTGDKWHPALTSVPEALATGNLDLRTGCRVTRVVTDADGRARGVEYVDALGERRVQEAGTVILAAYTFENLRLMFLSAEARHPDGVGNNRGQLGKHFMTKMFSHVDGDFPDIVFNRHTGPAAQAMVLDDYLTPEFDSVAHGFLGGCTLGAENQFLPIQISREALPADVPRWGKGYRDHLRRWQHFGVVRMQPEALAQEANFIDLDPHHRDRSGLGLPVLRVTYDLRQNERRLAEFMEQRSEEILRAMGAARTWRGPSFTGAGSSHDLGGARMGDDPGATVVDRHLHVHDTPGLYVFSGAVLPTCPGINPTMSIWAVMLRATDQLVASLRGGAAS